MNSPVIPSGSRSQSRGHAPDVPTRCTFFAGNKQSLMVNFVHLAQTMPNPAIWLADNPRPMLEIFHKAAKDVAREQYRELFENEEHLEVYVRVTDLPITDSIRDLRHSSLFYIPF